MNLRKLLYSSAILAVAALTSCNQVDEDDRYIYVKPAEVSKRILIEDFTGQRCVNCPEANNVIHELQEQYGADNIIAVGIHSGSFGKTPAGRPYPLFTETGDYYFNQRGIIGQPTGVFDRQVVSENTNVWGTIVYNEIQKQANVMLDATTEYDSDSRTLNITVNAESTEDLTSSLQVWLTEDDIVGVQYFPGNVIEREYVHNHVFRTTVNDRDGDSFNLVTGEKKTATYSITLDESWKPENMDVVAFVFNSSGVQQAVKTAVINTETEPETDSDENVNE